MSHFMSIPEWHFYKMFNGTTFFFFTEKHFMLGAEFDLTFEIRPRSITGLIFHCKSHQGYSLSVFLKKGKVSL